MGRITPMGARGNQMRMESIRAIRGMTKMSSTTKTPPASSAAFTVPPSNPCSPRLTSRPRQGRRVRCGLAGRTTPMGARGNQMRMESIIAIRSLTINQERTTQTPLRESSAAFTAPPRAKNPTARCRVTSFGVPLNSRRRGTALQLANRSHAHVSAARPAQRQVRRRSGASDLAEQVGMSV